MRLHLNWIEFMMENQIRLAKEEDHDAIAQLFRRCSLAMRSEGIMQWSEDYPKPTELSNDISNNSLWIYLLNQSVAGTITINGIEHPEYKKVNWIHSNFQVVHRLAVHPEYQKQGIARELMQFAEEHCANSGYASIRLDAFTKNPVNINFYSKLNYDQVGMIYFKYHTEPFACFEKLLWF